MQKCIEESHRIRQRRWEDVFGEETVLGKLDIAIGIRMGGSQISMPYHLHEGEHEHGALMIVRLMGIMGELPDGLETLFPAEGLEPEGYSLWKPAKSIVAPQDVPSMMARVFGPGWFERVQRDIFVAWMGMLFARGGTLRAEPRHHRE